MAAEGKVWLSTFHGKGIHPRFETLRSSCNPAGGSFWGCLGVGLLTIGIGLSGPIGWTAYGFIAAGSMAAAGAACFGG